MQQWEWVQNCAAARNKWVLRLADKRHLDKAGIYSEYFIERLLLRAQKMWVGAIRHVNLLNISNIYWIFYCSPPLSDDAGLDGAIRHVNWEEDGDGDGEMEKFTVMTKTGVVFETTNLWCMYLFYIEQCSLEISNLFNIQFKLHTFVSLVNILYLFGRLHCVALTRVIYSHNF